jgi:3-hydroxyisobutyrate dehydrogenase
MIGCDDSILPRVKAVMSMTGKSESLFHCGPIGSGVSVKLINNYLSVTNILVASEGLNLGMKMGLDPKKLTDIINASSGQTWITMRNNPVPGVQPDSVASRGYKGGFAIELAEECIELANKMAGDVGAKLALGPRTLEVWREAMVDPRCKGLDARSIFRWISESDE